MAEFQGNRISELKDPRCWRLCHVQTSGCMATERRTDEQREQQQIVLDYVTDGGCDVVGLGDTRLGDDATEVCRMARGIEGRARGEALMRTLEGLDARQRAAALEARTGVTRVHWQSAGSHKDESDIWRGGVALGSYGDAAAREFGAINDARGWGRYTGRIYQGKGGKALVVVVVYAPDAQYDVVNEERGDYSQRLGQRAATVTDGTTAGKWKPGKAMPKPTAEQVKHPKHLLFSDLKLQLWHYACKPLHTLVVMGDMNTDLYAERHFLQCTLAAETSVRQRWPLRLSVLSSRQRRAWLLRKRSLRVGRIWLIAPSTRKRVTKPATGARRRWPSATLTAAGTSSPAACRRPSAHATITATPARMPIQLPLTQVAPCKSSQPTARSAVLRIGTTSNGLDVRLSLRLTCCTTPDNARTPLAGGLCAAHRTQSHLLAARSISTLAKDTS